MPGYPCCCAPGPDDPPIPPDPGKWPFCGGFSATQAAGCLEFSEILLNIRSTVDIGAGWIAGSDVCADLILCSNMDRHVLMTAYSSVAFCKIFGEAGSASCPLINPGHLCNFASAACTVSLQFRQSGGLCVMDAFVDMVWTLDTDPEASCPPTNNATAWYRVAYSANQPYGVFELPAVQLIGFSDPYVPCYNPPQSVIVTNVDIR